MVQARHWRKIPRKHASRDVFGWKGCLVTRRRDWCFPGRPGGRFSLKPGFPGNAETVLGDVRAPHMRVRAI